MRHERNVKFRFQYPESFIERHTWSFVYLFCMTAFALQG